MCLDSEATMVVESERRHESFHLHEPQIQMRPKIRIRRLRKGTTTATTVTPFSLYQRKFNQTNAVCNPRTNPRPGGAQEYNYSVADSEMERFLYLKKS